MEARKPEENIEIKPYDVISIPRADLIYVIGSVRRSGGFALTEREHITVLQALSMAEGLDRTASGRNARILRAAAGTSTRKEIRVNVNDILAGKISDVPLQADDILFVPNSASKAAILRGIEAAITTASGIAVWGRY
jgi:polysaccharide export outer membrane protein